MRLGNQLSELPEEMRAAHRAAPDRHQLRWAGWPAFWPDCSAVSAGIHM